MQTTDTSNLFQSDAQHAKASYRAAKQLLHAESGDPITLASKPLRVVVRQKGNREADAWCAESGFVVRRVGLETGKTKQIFRGHFGPVTSIDFFSVPAPPPSSPLAARPAREIMVTGSWDKSIRVWDVQTKSHLSTTLAHTDFVKALVVIPSLEIVVTGSSDKDLRIWDLSHLSSSIDLSSLTPDTTPEPLIETVPQEGGEDEDDDGKARATTGSVALVSVDSLGALKTWELSRDAKGELQGVLRSEIRPHEIGIYDLVLGDGEIWTASADNSILMSTFDASSPSTAPVPTLRIPHPAGVKSLLPLALLMPSLNSPHLLTGSTDEALRIFDLSSLDSTPPSSSTTAPWIGLPATGVLPGLVREIEGHAHDVMELGVFTKQVDGKREAWIDVQRTVLVPVEDGEKEKESLLTEEEERELEELMRED
ncbi:hypothetical protein RQP46_004575 [Phenoliferia psychrophenolica]